MNILSLFISYNIISIFIYFAGMNKIHGLILIALIGILFSSCVKKMKKEDVQESLKSAMDLYLNHQPRIDTSGVKFSVLEVIYFEDKSNYICNFKVNMKGKR